MIREGFKRREHLLSDAVRESVRASIKVSNLWLKRFFERCTSLNQMLGEVYKTMANGDQFRANYAAAVEAVPAMLTWDENGGLHIRQAEPFVSQIDPDNVTDPDALEGEAEDLAEEPVGAVGGAEEQPHESVQKATHTDEVSPQDAENESPDNEKEILEVDQQRDLEDGVVADEDFQNEEIINEDSADENDAEQASNEDLYEEVDLEIHDERSGGTQQKVLKITITLEY